MANPFYLRNGTEAHTVEDLYEALKEADEDEFEFHVSDEKNDFAEWVEHSLGKTDLATKIRNQYDLDSLVTVLENEVTTEPTHTKHEEEETGGDSQEDLEKQLGVMGEDEDVDVNQEDFQNQKEQIQEGFQISSEAPHMFILKEFLFGALFGLLLGLILTLALLRAGVFL